MSSLKTLNKKVLDEKMEEYGVNNINELKEYILEYFETCIEDSKDDSLTRMYFMRLLDHENSELKYAYEQDVEDLRVFIYEKEDKCFYYIPSEIKDVIKKMLKEMFTVEKMNLENAINTPIVKDLKGLLNVLTLKDLKHISDLFMINRLSNKPKKQLISIIYSALTNEKKLSEVMKRFVDKEFDLLNELMRNKGTIQNNKIGMEEYRFLYMLGIVFLFKQNDKFYISMTDDIYNTIKKIELSKFNEVIEENSKAYNLVKSMVELYGIISYGELGYYYSLYYENGEELDIPNNALFFCDRLDGIKHIHTEHNLYYVNYILCNDEFESILDDIVSRQEKIKRKPIKIDELLKYLDSNYYEENESKIKFKKYLKDRNICDEDIEKIILTISKMYRLGNSFIDTTVYMLQEYGLEITEDNMQ